MMASESDIKKLREELSQIKEKKTVNRNWLCLTTHKILNRLMGLDANFELFMIDDDPDKRLADIRNAFSDINDLFEDCLELTDLCDKKMLRGKDLETFEIMECLEEIMLRYKEETQASIIIKKDNNDPYDGYEVLSDYRHLYEILKELIANALTYRLEGTNVKISLCREMDETWIHIENEIDQVSAEALENYFNVILRFWNEGSIGFAGNVKLGLFKALLHSEKIPVEFHYFITYHSLTMSLKFKSCENDHLCPGAKIAYMDASEKDFSRSDLRGCEFMGVDLKDTNMAGCNLENSSFISCNMTDTDLSLANLRKCRFIDCKMHGTKLSWSDCQMAEFKDLVSFTELIADNTDFRLAVFDHVKFGNNCMDNAIMTYTRFNQSDLSDVSLKEINFSHARFTDTLLYNTDFTRANMTYVDLKEVNCMGANFTGANLSNTCLDQALLTKADFTEACMINSSMEKACYGEET